MRYLLILFILLPSLCSAGMVINPYSVATQLSSGLSDDFSTDTSSNYTAVENGITITGGAAHGTTNWNRNSVYNSTSVGSADQIVSADVTFNASDYGYVTARVSGTGSTSTGYYAELKTGGLTLRSFSGTGTGTYIVGNSTAYTSPATLSIETSGTSIIVKVNGSAEITTTDSTYTTGDYAGLGCYRGVNGTDVTVDNWSAGAN